MVVSLYPAALFAAKPAYRVLAQDRGHAALVRSDGKVEHEVPMGHGAHDIHALPNGRWLLHASPTRIVEVDPAEGPSPLWTYEAKPAEGYSGPIEIHAFERLPNGLTMVAESGNRRIVEVDRQGGIVKSVPLLVEHPDAHRDTRMVRKLANGNYLVCHEADATVREYDGTGKVVWSYRLDLGGRPRADGHGVEGHGVEVYGAIRLPSGNTLIAGGNNNRVLEVNSAGEIVWRLDHNELDGIQLAWVTTLHALPNGNIIVGNCHAGENNPQLFEVTRGKKVVWKFHNWQVFGDHVAASHVLDLPEGTIR